MVFRTIVLFILSSCLATSWARLTSFGDVTAIAARSELEDSDFVIDPKMGVATKTPDFIIRTAELSRFPVLGGVDVQTQITRVFARAGKTVVAHYHPRGLEVLNVLKGSYIVTMLFEGLNPRKVVNEVKAGQSTVFPQGLIHQIVCTNTTNCVSVSIFNTADPGFVPVPLMME